MDVLREAIIFLKIVVIDGNIKVEAIYSCSDPPGGRLRFLEQTDVDETTHIISVPLVTSNKSFVKVAYLPDNCTPEFLVAQKIVSPDVLRP